MLFFLDVLLILDLQITCVIPITIGTIFLAIRTMN